MSKIGFLADTGKPTVEELLEIIEKQRKKIEALKASEHYRKTRAWRERRQHCENQWMLM